jgi:hypothetical protein
MLLALWLSASRTKRRRSGPGSFGVGFVTEACFGSLAMWKAAAGAGRETAEAYVDWARPGVAGGNDRWGGRACWDCAGGHAFSVALGAGTPHMKASKWRWATEARSSLRDARALRKWGLRSETSRRWLSRKTAIGLNRAWPSEALVVAATVESRSAAWRGPWGSGGSRGMAAHGAQKCVEVRGFRVGERGSMLLARLDA